MIIQEFSMYLKCRLKWMNYLIITFLHFLSSSKRGLKNSGLNGALNPDLYNASAVLYQLSYHYHLSSHLWAYNWPTQWPAPSRPNSWTGRGLHQYHRVQGSNPHSGLNFSGLSHCCLSSGKMQWSNALSCVFFHQFCDYLHENAVVLRSVDESFGSFYNSIKTDYLISMVREEYSQDVILDFILSSY